MTTSAEHFNFGAALAELHDGKRVQRAGWNGKGMYLFRVAAWTFTDGHNDNLPNLPFLAMKTATNEVVPWLASQADMLATDWQVA